MSASVQKSQRDSAPSQAARALLLIFKMNIGPPLTPQRQCALRKHKAVRQGFKEDAVKKLLKQEQLPNFLLGLTFKDPAKGSSKPWPLTNIHLSLI